MKAIICRSTTLIAVAAFICSFSPLPGGEGFEIYIGNKLLTQQFGSQVNEARSLQLDQNSYNETLTVKYYHCGQVGKDRVLTIKDGQDKILKEFHFANSPSGVNSMTCSVKDIMSLKKGNATVLKLYYSSSEIPRGRLLASIVTGNTVLAKS